MISKKYLLIYVGLFVVAVLISGQIDINNTKNENADLFKYYEMAEHSPDITENVQSPFVYRIAAPWLAGLMPFSIKTNFYVLNIIALFAMSFAFLMLLLLYELNEKIAILMTIALLFNRYFFQFLSWDFYQLSDTVSYFLLYLSIIYILKKNFIGVALTLSICMVFREVALLALPFGIVYLFNERKRKELVKFLISFIPPIIVFILIRTLIEPHSKLDVLSAFKGGLDLFFSPNGIIKTFFIPFAPLTLIPIWFWRESVLFIKKYKAEAVLFLFAVTSTLFGTDIERLMAPSAPAVYLLIGMIISKIVKGKDVFSFYLIIGLLIIVHSLYHLWGLVKISGENYSIVVTGLTSMLVLILSIYVRRNQEGKLLFFK